MYFTFHIHCVHFNYPRSLKSIPVREALDNHLISVPRCRRVAITNLSSERFTIIQPEFKDINQ